MFLLGLILLFISIISGDTQAGFFLIFPFIIGSGVYATLGILLIVASFFLYLINLRNVTISHEPQNENSKPLKKENRVEGGGIVLIGPIPIIIGSNWKITIILVIVAILILVAFYVLL
jgi:uncharacterized protein (TIGR00304 family)